MLITDKDVKRYPKSGYMYAKCPGCNEWEAPMSKEEITSMKEPSAYHGSTMRRIDTQPDYYREVWRECFQCPKCHTKFSVEMSNT